MDAALLEAAFKRPDDERRELADRLYASLPAADVGFELSHAQEAELAGREERLARTGPIGEDWETVKQRLLTTRDA